MYTLLPFLVIIIAFWFLLIRPQQKRQRQVREMQAQIGVGDEVMLTSGFYAEVRDIADDHALVEIADGVTVKVARAAIGQVVPKDEVLPEETSDDEPTSVSVDRPTESDVAETPEQTLERLRGQGESK